MKKYDFALNMDPACMDYKALSRVAKGSFVLELGCAYGRMTRYLKEDLGCRVYVVELDAEALESAKQFADGHYLGDLDGLDIKKVFPGITFDYVLFSDVLEHLKNPVGILSDIKDVLNDEGEIIISIPNICHSDILANMYLNKFTYTDIGLLDNTHIRFWGKDDIEGFVKETGYDLMVLDGVCIGAFLSEQKPNLEALPPTLVNELVTRPYYDVYQYFMVLKKEGWLEAHGCETEDRLEDHSKCGWLSFVDIGEGFIPHMDICPEYTVDGVKLSIPKVPRGTKAVKLHTNNQYYTILGNVVIKTNITDCAVRVMDKSNIDIDLPDGVEWMDVTIGSSNANYANDTYKENLETISKLMDKNKKLDKIIAEKDKKLDEYALHVQQMTLEKNALINQISSHMEASNMYKQQYESVVNSACWKLTKPIRKILDLLKRSRLLRLPIKFIRYLKRYGFKATVKKVLQKLHIIKASNIGDSIQTVEQMLKDCRNLDYLVYNEDRAKEKKIKKRNKILFATNTLDSIESARAIKTFMHEAKKSGYFVMVMSKADGALREQMVKDGHVVVIAEDMYSRDFVQKKSDLFDLIVVNTIESNPVVTGLSGVLTPVIWWVHESKKAYTKDIVEDMPEALASNIHVYCSSEGSQNVLSDIRPLYSIDRLLCSDTKNGTNTFRKDMQKVISDVTSKTATSTTDDMWCLLRDFERCAGINDFITSKSKLISYSKHKDRKRALLITHELSMTGAPLVLKYLADSLIRQGVDVVVACRIDGLLIKEYAKQDIPVIVLEGLHTHEFLKNNAEYFDMVIPCTVVACDCIETLKDARTNVIWWIHDALAAYIGCNYDTCMIKELPNNTRVVCGGEYARKQLLKYYPKYTADILYYAIPDEAKAVVPKFDMGREEGKFAFAVIATISTRKGQDILAQAIDMLTDEEREMSQFYFVGPVYEKPIKTSIDTMLIKYPDSVVYIPEVERDALLSVYQQCDAIVCSSRDDPLPVFITEAMMTSKVIICSENTGSAPILEREKAGLVYKNDDPKELAKKISEVLARPNGFEDMKKNARKSFEKYFTVESFDREVKSICDSIVDYRNDPDILDTVVSVVIPTYNGGPQMKELIDRLNNQKRIRRLDVVAVDSGSKDATVQILRDGGARVIEIPQEEFTHSYSRNLGIKNAIGDIIILMTQDALPLDENWAYNLVLPIVQGEAVAVSCMEECPEDTELYYKMAVWGHKKFVDTVDKDKLNKLRATDDAMALRKKASLSDVTCASKTSVLKQFPYRYGFAEDLDLGVRLLQSGYAIKLISSTKSVHGHNRPAGYYIKRCIIQEKTMKYILPAIVQAERSQEEVSRCIVYCSTMLARGIEACRKAGDKDKTVDKFIDRFVKCLRENQTGDIIKVKVPCDDKVLGWTIEKLEPYSGKYTPIQTEMFDFICYYLDNSIRKYFKEMGIDKVTDEIRESIYDCLIKQYCCCIGSDLSRIPENEALYQEFSDIHKGV